jgi:O-antigen/teichoic acid export membrane protein
MTAGAEPAERSRLDRVLVDGMAWTAVLRWSAQVVSWIGTAFAARLLAPGDYGLIGMAMLAIGFVRMVEDFGMDAVLVQDRSIQGARQAQLAGLILLAGAVFSAAFMLLSVPIASFFNEPQVALLIVALSLLCIGDALQVIPRALLQREMAFRKLAALQFLQILVTQVVLVSLAYWGFGVWSLVFNTLAGAAAVTLLLLWWRPFSIARPRAISELAAPLMQGWRILVSRFAYYAYTSADQAVIGRMLGRDALGVYSFALTFSTMISQEISSVLSRVVPGVLSTVQTRRDDLQRYFLLLTELLCFLTLPVCFGMAVTADLVVAVVLGPQWEAVTLPLRILCLYAAFYSCQVLVGHVLLWTGRFRVNMWCSILAGVVMPICYWIGVRWGLPGVAWAWVISFPLVNLPAFVICFRAISISGRDWLRTFEAPLVGCAVMVAAVMAVRSVLPETLSLPAVTGVSVAVGACAYGAVLLLLFRRRVAELWSFLRVMRRVEARPPAGAESATV